ncbi:MAG: hypothetical protein IJK74_06730 [Bacteroidales bacterium]|nr:hypothetical protein [Bacteroidales bacterium]
MKLIQKDNAVFGVREEYVSPALEIYSVELTGMLLGSPGEPGDDDEIKDLGDY